MNIFIVYDIIYTKEDFLYRGEVAPLYSYFLLRLERFFLEAFFLFFVAVFSTTIAVTRLTSDVVKFM